MGWTNGTFTQKFKVSVDISKLMEYITDNVLQQINTDKEISSVDLDEYYADGDNLEIRGTYSGDFKSYYAPATRYEPAEEDLQRPFIGEDGVGLLDGIPEDILKFIDIDTVEEDEDDATYDVPEPDENDVYDRWRDRQLEED